MVSNFHVLMGRLTKDPEVKEFQSGAVMATYTLAVQRAYRREGDPEADFFRLTAFGKKAEFAEKYFRQGTKILVSYHEQNDKYEKDGRTVYGTSRIVDDQEFAESKRAQQERDGRTEGETGRRSAIGSGTRRKEPEREPSLDDDGFMNIPEGIDEELPFI